MIKYSHIALIIPLQSEDGRDVTNHLELEPSQIRESKGSSWSETEGRKEHTSYSWMLESELNADHRPIDRIHNLLEQIESQKENILSLDKKYSRWIDVLFHVTPQRPHGVTGEFDWITLPHQTMRRMSDLELSISYESIWFNHPDWNRSWLWKAFNRKKK
ncbi:MAG: DUF4279 domain-containing protein [Opitutaceae bacterium]